MGFYESDDFVDVSFKRWAFNTVRSEEVLRLAGVVKLLHEEVRNGAMRQAGNPW